MRWYGNYGHFLMSGLSVRRYSMEKALLNHMLSEGKYSPAGFLMDTRRIDDINESIIFVFTMPTKKPPSIEQPFHRLLLVDGHDKLSHQAIGADHFYFNMELALAICPDLSQK